MKEFSILVAHDHFIVRHGLKHLIANTKQLRLIAESAEINDCYEKLLEYQPDVAIIGFQFNSIEEAEDLNEVLSQLPKTAVMYLGSSLDKQEIFTAMRISPQSYVLTECDKEEMTDAIFAASKGEQFMCGKVLDVITDAEKCHLQSESAKKCLPVTLSKREIEIIKLIAREQSCKMIADKLFLSEHTIRTHRKNIMQKTGVNNTAGIVMFAIRHRHINPVEIV